MDWYPLWNSLRIAAIACVIVFFSGIALAYYVARLPRILKGILDVVLTLPLVLPPTVCGWLLLLVFGLQHPVGIALNEAGVRFVMTGTAASWHRLSSPSPSCTARCGGPLKASMKPWPGVERPWGCRTPLFSGISACRTANRASCRHGPGLCQSPRRIWGDEHAYRLYPQAYGDHFDDGVPIMADQ